MCLSLAEDEALAAVLDDVGLSDEDFVDDAVRARLDDVFHLHGLEDEQRLPRLDGVACGWGVSGRGRDGGFKGGVGAVREIIAGGSARAAPAHAPAFTRTLTTLPGMGATTRCAPRTADASARP